MSTGAQRCSGLEVEVEVRVELGDRERAEAIARALRPDDATAPEGLEVAEAVEGGDLVVRVRACGRGLMTVRNTVDEVLEFLYAALRAIEAASRS